MRRCLESATDVTAGERERGTLLIEDAQMLGVCDWLPW